MDNHDSKITIIAELLRRYTQGQTLSNEDKELLSRWRSEHIRNEKLFAKFQDPELLGEDLHQMGRTDTEVQLDRFNRRIRQKKKTKQLYRTVATIAAMLVALSFGCYFLFLVENKTLHNNQLTSKYGADVLPASNKATLTLSSGEVLELRTDQKELIADDCGLTYTDGKNIEGITNVQYATLSTPRGGQYQIVLSDGTKVHLNAESSLQYPLHFTGTQRRVELKGEAYFEVTHNKKLPFVVTTSAQEVNVLGTVFNIKAYSNRETTTLVSGSVSVTSNATKQKTILIPNKQAILYNGNITTRDVDVNDYTAWNQGRFQGDLVTLQELTTDIERWYDVRFIYPAVYRNNERALISINRTEKLSKVLQMLETTYNVRFRIEGKEVRIQ